MLCLLVVALIVSSCARKEAIHIAGSTTVLPAASKAAEQFHLKHPEVNIVVNAGGSGAQSR